MIVNRTPHLPPRTVCWLWAFWGLANAQSPYLLYKRHLYRQVRAVDIIRAPWCCVNSGVFPDTPVTGHSRRPVRSVVSAEQPTQDAHQCRAAPFSGKKKRTPSDPHQNLALKCGPTLNSCVMLRAGVIWCSLCITLLYHISGAERLSADFSSYWWFFHQIADKINYYFGSNAAPSHKMSWPGQYLMCDTCHRYKHWIIWTTKAMSG